MPEILTLSAARPRIGRIVDRVLLRRQPVLLRRGTQLVQIAPYDLPEPVHSLPLGAYRKREEDVARVNRAPANHRPQK